MIGFIDNKQLNRPMMDVYLELSQNHNQWANFGPASRYLEDVLCEKLNLDEDLDVVATSSGTAALWAAMLYHQEKNHHHPLHPFASIKWAVSDFTFPCFPKALFNMEFMDCDEDGVLDTTSPLDTSGWGKWESISGILFTDLYGSANLDRYKAVRCGTDYYVFKNVVVDGAMNFNGNPKGPFEILSLHHTKPWGFGEGGCVVVPKEAKDAFYSIINFGRWADQQQYQQFSFNGKMSEIAAAAHIAWLDSFDDRPYRDQFYRIKEIAESFNLRVIDNPGCPCSVPVVCPEPVMDLENDILVLHKYYEPITGRPTATRLYERMVNWPCHPGVAAVSNNQLKELMERICFPSK